MRWIALAVFLAVAVSIAGMFILGNSPVEPDLVPLVTETTPKPEIAPETAPVDACEALRAEGFWCTYDGN